MIITFFIIIFLAIYPHYLCCHLHSHLFVSLTLLFTIMPISLPQCIVNPWIIFYLCLQTICLSAIEPLGGLLSGSASITNLNLTKRKILKIQFLFCWDTNLYS